MKNKMLVSLIEADVKSLGEAIEKIHGHKRQLRVNTPDEWLALNKFQEAVNACEIALHRVRQAFEREISNEPVNESG